LTHPYKINFITVKKALSGLYYLPATFIDKQKLQLLEKAAS
jgi:hypothetical protein